MRQYSDDLRSKLIHTWQNWEGSQQELAEWWGVVGVGCRRCSGAGGKRAKRRLLGIGTALYRK